ncbi:MAG: helix-turn-helix domain-containing protein [Chloroflexi bacterium]|nr:helix-turn-helix domain-containing protein [Chloroflexota bacterium]
MPGRQERSPGAREVKRRQPSSRVVLRAVAVWRLLDERGISQNELARLCGLSSGYMSQLVGGTRSPSPRVRRRIQQALEITDFDELFLIERLDA